MKLSNIENRSQIPNLQMVGSGAIQGFKVEKEIEQTALQFFDTTTEQMGFYSVSFVYTRDPTAGGMVILMLGAPVVWAWSILGVPVTIQEFTCFARLRIFDSSGNLVYEDITDDKFSQAVGLYYGGDNAVTEKAEKKYSEMLKDLLNSANKNSDKINTALNSAGKISDEPNVVTEVTTKIKRFESIY